MPSWENFIISLSSTDTKPGGTHQVRLAQAALAHLVVVVGVAEERPGELERSADRA